MEAIAYKFVEWEVPKLEDLKDSFPYKMKLKVLSKERLARAEKDRLFTELFANGFSKSGIPLHGWMFSFTPFLHRYFVQFDYGHIAEYFAPDKTSIRRHMTGITRIVEVKD